MPVDPAHAKRASDGVLRARDAQPVWLLAVGVHERAEGGRVEELDPGEVDDEPRGRLVDRAGEARPHHFDVVEVEIARQPHHEGVSDAVDADYRLVAEVPIVVHEVTYTAEPWEYHRGVRRRGIATFGVFVLVAEVIGHSATARVDRALHVAPLAPSNASYYPFLLAGAKIVAALVLAALLARLMRAHASADAGHRLLGRLGQPGHREAPRLRLGLSPRIWLLSFAATSLVYLVHVDAEGLADGRWPLLAPLLHTYALPVFAALSVLVALAWSLTRWVHAVEDYGRRTLERARLILHAALRVVRSGCPLPVDDHGPRRRFGLAFESRPPPLPA